MDAATTNTLRCFALLVLELVFAQLCPEDHFHSTFIDECLPCPKSAESGCQSLGPDANDCERNCVTGGKIEQVSNGINLVLPIGISIGVISLLLILVLALYFQRRRRRNDGTENGPEADLGEASPMGDETGENSDEENGPVENEELQMPPPEESPSDLDKANDGSISSALNLMM